MAHTFIKAEKAIRTALGLLEREIILPRLIWQDAAGDFTGAKDDTISIRLPGRTTANKRALRSGAPIVMSDIAETKVDLTLDTHVYSAVPITDEQLTLDIEDFGEQVLSPMMRAVAYQLEADIATAMTSATYATTVEFNQAKPYDTVVDARKALNDADVPLGGRALLVGSGLEATILKSDNFVKADQAGDNDALREAKIGRIAGFDVYTSNALPEDEGVAFHRTAFAQTLQAPKVPAGAGWGAVASFAGMALRTLRDYDFTNVRDRALVDAFSGTAAVEDEGVFVRAVHIVDAV